MNQTVVNSDPSQALKLAGLTRELANCCVSKEAEIFQRNGLSAGEGQVLLAVAAMGEASPSVLAATLKLGRSRLTPLAQSLVEKGFLMRSESEDDRRVRTLRLTDDGRSAACDAANHRLNFHERLLSMFPVNERDRLLEVLTQLKDRMQQVRQEFFLHETHSGDSSGSHPR